MISKAVLHIDDDPTFTDLCTRALASAGWQVEGLNDSTRWCETLGNRGIVLLDLDMPQYSGIDVLRDIKCYDETRRVIVVTGVRETAVVANCFSLGAEYCLFKPLNGFRNLLDILEKTWFRINHWNEAANHAATDSTAATQMVD